jgi:mannose PTS system EIIA component
MSIGVLLISHESLGQDMLDISVKAMGFCPLAVKVLGIPLDADPDTLSHQAQALVSSLDSGDGVLVLTDLCGATPANIASRLTQDNHIMIVAGFNLPMLMRVFNYAQLTLMEIAERAINGGRQGILLMPSCSEA